MARKALGPASQQVAAAVTSALADHPGRPVVVACSGGADSLALAAGTVVAAGRCGRPARALVLDHGWQPDSADVAAQAGQSVTGLGLPTRVERVRPGCSGGPEAAAREVRLAALSAEAAADGALVLLGHTLDDQAEQVLLGLARGSGPRSLAGMPEFREPLLRPLLGLRRATTRASCAELGLVALVDPANADSRFTRSRVRHDLLPVLEQSLGPGVAEGLVRSADLCRLDADALDELARAVALPSDPGCQELLGLRVAVRHRVLRRWLRAHDAGPLTRQHVLAVDALLTDWHGQGPLDLPRVRVRRTAGRLHVTPTR